MRLAKSVVGVFALLVSVCAFGQTRPNLVLISVDTLRQDHVSAYGYKRKTTPNIDRLLKSGVWFQEAYCNVPLTTPSFGSLMTSRYPHETGATRNGVSMLVDMETLAEILNRNGYATAAFLSNWPLKAHISNLNKGFEIYDDNFSQKRWLFFNDERDAKHVAELASAWLSQKPRQPFFLWAHFSDPHQPYLFHRGFNFSSKSEPASELQNKIDAYDSEVAYVDYYLGVLLAKLHSLGYDRNSLVVFMADHGEELSEHGYTGHGRFLYEAAMRIPLGLSGPGISPGGKIQAVVELLDLAPTILAYLGFPPGKEMRGRNLMPYIRGEKSWPEHYLVYFETYPGAVRGEGMEKVANIKDPTWVGLKLDNLKIHYRVPGSRWEMYNLQADPGEKKNLADPVNQVFLKYSEELLAWYRSWEKSVALGRTEALTGEDLKKLESLGYLK